MLTAEEERLFYRLIVNCDDYGRFDAKPTVVRNSCFKLDDGKIRTDKVEIWIQRLFEVGLIILYENSGKLYLQFVTWDDYQQRRAQKSKYPAPDDEGSVLISNDINCNQLKHDPAKADRTRISNTNTNTNKGGVGGKQNYAEFVKLTEEEHKKLLDQFGEEGAKQRIEKLNLYKGSTGKKYASDYLTILNWERKNGNGEKTTPQKPTFNNFTGRSYDAKALEEAWLKASIPEDKGG